MKVTEQDINPDGSFTFPEGVTVISDGAFYECESLEQIVIPERVRKIGGEAFRNCSLMYITQAGDKCFTISRDRIDEKSCAFSLDIASAFNYAADHKWLEYGYTPSEYIGNRYEPSEITPKLADSFIKAQRSIFESRIMYSFNYDSTSMDLFLYRMMKLIGAEEIEKMLKIDEISVETFKYYTDDECPEEFNDVSVYEDIKEKFLRNVEFRSEVRGIAGLAISYIKEIDKKYSALKDKEKIKRYKKINECLSQDNYEEFNKILEETFGKEKLVELQENANNKVIESTTDVFMVYRKNAELAEEHRIPDAQLGVVERMIKKCIKESGCKNVEDIEKWFYENTGHGAGFDAQWIQDKRETIVNLINETIAENADILSSENVIFEVLKQGKLNISSPWIKNILESGNKNGFTVDELKKLFGKDVDPADVIKDGSKKIVLKPGMTQRDFYREVGVWIDDRKRGAITYEKIESMFGGIEVDDLTPEELKNFNEYYKRYRDEILSDKEVQKKLSEICMMVKDGSRLGVTPQSLVEAVRNREVKYTPEHGDSELAQSLAYAMQYDMSQKGYEEREIEMDATNNTSLINLKNMEKRGLITIHEGEKYNDGVDKAFVSLEVNVDKMQEALEELSEKLKKRQDLMVTYVPLSR